MNTNKIRAPKILGKFKLSILIVLVVVLCSSALMIAKLNADTGVIPLTQQQFVHGLNKALSDNVKSNIQSSIQSQQALSRGVVSEDEKMLIDYYTGDEFNNQLENLSANGDYAALFEFVFEKFNEYLLENFAAEQNDGEGNSRASNVLSRDFFVGVEKSAYDCIYLFDNLFSVIGEKIRQIAELAYDIFDLGQDIWNIVMVSPLASIATAAVSAVLGTLKAILGAIPIVGWIALGLIGCVEIAIFIAMLVNGYNRKGFRVGVDVQTGWFGIPIGVRWVCE